VSFYEGRALRAEPTRTSTLGRLRRVLVVILGFALFPVLAQAPWTAWRARLFAVREIGVEGLRYLEEPEVIATAGLKPGVDLFGVDPDRVRQALLLHPRIASAWVSRRPWHAIRLKVEERVPVLLVQHGSPWELDSTGVLLPPLADGVVADVPMLTGPDLSDAQGGTRVRSPTVQRGLAWVGILGRRELGLSGSVSEIDVSEERSTVLTLLNGTRVRASAWPPGVRALSALRVVLADLQKRGKLAEEVDLRFDNQVIVRPIPAVAENATRTS